MSQMLEPIEIGSDNDEVDSVTPIVVVSSDDDNSVIELSSGTVMDLQNRDEEQLTAELDEAIASGNEDRVQQILGEMERLERGGNDSRRDEQIARELQQQEEDGMAELPPSSNALPAPFVPPSLMHLGGHMSIESMLSMLGPMTNVMMTGPSFRIISGGFGGQPNVDGMSYEELLELSSRIGNVRNRGADPQDIQRLPERTLAASDISGSDSSSSSQLDQCSICFESYKVGDRVRTLPCLHRFHSDCVDRWLASNKACPVCRLQIDQLPGAP